MNRLTANDIHIICDLPPVANKGDMACFDTEFFGMDKARLHRPHGKFASMACTYDGVNVYYITDSNLIPEFMRRIDAALWVGHNIAFDIRQLRMYTEITPRKRVYDTMLVDQIRFRGYYDDFALNDLARRYLHTYLDKSQQKSFEKSTQLTTEQITYGALDVAATWRIAQVQREQIDENDLRIWQEIERPFMWVLLDIKGIKVDVEKWMTIATEKGDTASKLWKECQEEYGINIRSVKQLREFFAANKIKLDSTDVATLSSHVNKHPIIQKILDYRKPAKGSSTYGADWIDKHVEEDGLVYASWNQMGARSGRMSCSSPNLQNIPVRTEPVYRESFIAEDDEVLIISDWSSQEPRITAFFSQDENLISIFKSGHDIYIATGFRVFRETFDKKDDRRKDMKALVLGLTYGMTEFGLSEKLVAFPAEIQEQLDEAKTAAEERNIRIEYARYLIDRFMEEFPGVKQYIKNMIASAKKLGYVTTILGRKCWISPYEKGLERDAPNYPVQGSAADAMKLAAVRIHNTGRAMFGYSPIRMFIHDELVCSVKERHAEDAQRLINDAMVGVAEEMHPGIPAKADPFVGRAWSEKK